MTEAATDDLSTPRTETIQGDAMRTFALMVALLALPGFAPAQEDDPEPPSGAAALRKLKGTWNAVRRVVGGMERPYTTVTYKFEKDKATHTFGKGPSSRTMTLKADKKRKDVIEMAPDKGVTMRYFFKIEKGELYLVPDRSNDPKAKADFSGNNVPVIILKQEK